MAMAAAAACSGSCVCTVLVEAGIITAPSAVHALSVTHLKLMGFSRALVPPTARALSRHPCTSCTQGGTTGTVRRPCMGRRPAPERQPPHGRRVRASSVLVTSPAQRAERPRDPGGVAAFMSAHSKTPYVTHSMDISSGKGVVRGRRVQKLTFALQPPPAVEVLCPDQAHGLCRSLMTATTWPSTDPHDGHASTCPGHAFRHPRDAITALELHSRLSIQQHVPYCV